MKQVFSRGRCTLCGKSTPCIQYEYTYGKTMGAIDVTPSGGWMGLDKMIQESYTVLRGKGSVCKRCHRKHSLKMLTIHMTAVIIGVILLIFGYQLAQNDTREASWTPLMFIIGFFVLMMEIWYCPVSFYRVCRGRMSDYQAVELIKEKVWPSLQAQGYDMFTNPNEKRKRRRNRYLVRKWWR